MSKRVADKICKDSKQPKLTDFIKAKSEETATGMRKKPKIFVNLLVNVKTRIGKKDAKTICFVSAVPETQSSSITSEAHATTSAAVCTEVGASDSSTVNVTVTLNVTTETDEAGK